MEELTAVVSAVADADVCIYGDGSASAHVESHCLNKIYANVWAKVSSPPCFCYSDSMAVDLLLARGAAACIPARVRVRACRRCLTK